MKAKKYWLAILILIVVVILIFQANSFIPLLKPAPPPGKVSEPQPVPVLYYITVGLVGAITFFWTLFGDQIKFMLNYGFTRGQTKDAFAQAVSDEQEYLENLNNRLNADAPWEIKNFADLEASNWGLELEARKSRPKKTKLIKGRTEMLEEELRSKVSVRNYLEKAVLKGNPIMLKGEPGSGKTMMARRFTADMAQSALNSFARFSMKPPLPVYITLNSYSAVDKYGKPVPFFDFISKYLKEEFRFADYIVNNLEKLLKSGRIILVMDGLNEMPTEYNKERIRNIELFFRKDFPRAKCLITCRNIQFTSVDYQTLEINELNNEQIQKFIQIYCGEELVQEKFDEIRSSHGIALKRFRNPFILSLYLKRDPSRTAPDSLAMMYSEYVNDKFSAYAAEQPLLVDRLKKISFSMCSEGFFAGYADIDELSKKLNIDITDDFIEKCAKVNIVDRSLQGKFRFYHQIFQEYFSALVLDDIFRNGEDYKIYLENPAWEEIVLVWGGIVEDLPAILNQVLENNADVRNLCLSLKLCATNPGKIDEKSVNNIIYNSQVVFQRHHIIPRIELLKALAILETDYSIEVIGHILTNSTGWITELSIQILGKSENERAKEKLKACIKDVKSFEVFMQARYFLPFNSWLILYLRSQMGVSNFINMISFIWQYGFLFVPVLLIGFIYKSAATTEMDPLVLVARFCSLIWLISLLSLVRNKIRYIREDEAPFNFKTIKEYFGISEIILFAAILAHWFFGAETLYTLSLLLAAAAVLYVGYIIYELVKSVRRIATIFDVLTVKAKFLGILTLVVCAAILFRLYGPSWMLDGNNFGIGNDNKEVLDKIKFEEPSQYSIAVNKIQNLTYKHFTPVLLKVAGVIGTLSIIAFIVTFIFYIRISVLLKRWRKNESQKDMEKILAIIMNPRLWPIVKKYALRRLRRHIIPLRLINKLETYTDFDHEVMSELERTVYELKHAAA